MKRVFLGLDVRHPLISPFMAKKVLKKKVGKMVRGPQGLIKMFGPSTAISKFKGIFLVKTSLLYNAFSLNYPNIWLCHEELTSVFPVSDSTSIILKDQNTFPLPWFV